MPIRRIFTFFLCCCLLFFQTTISARVFESTDEYFRVNEPDSWRSKIPEGKMKWGIEKEGSRSLVRCGVTVTEDWAFSIIDNDDYLNGQTKERFKTLAAAFYDDIRIGHWDSHYYLGSQRALQLVFSGTVEGERRGMLTIQTIRNERLYTYSCVSTASEFLLAYHELLLIADTFSFTNKIQKTPNTEDNDISI